VREKVTVTLEVRWPWWWRWFYWPLTLFAAGLGLPVNPEIVVADVVRFARFYANGKRLRRLDSDDDASPSGQPLRFTL